MATQDADPRPDSREGLPEYRDEDQPNINGAPASRGDESLGQDTTPEHDARQGDPVYYDAVPEGSGGANSFDARYNEFQPGEGQEGAGTDPRTGEAVHGDGLRKEQPDEAHSGGFDAEQPRQVQEAGEVDEPNAEQPREQR